MSVCVRVLARLRACVLVRRAALASARRTRRPYEESDSGAGWGRGPSNRADTMIFKSPREWAANRDGNTTLAFARDDFFRRNLHRPTPRIFRLAASVARRCSRTGPL